MDFQNIVTIGLPIVIGLTIGIKYFWLMSRPLRENKTQPTKERKR